MGSREGSRSGPITRRRFVQATAAAGLAAGPLVGMGGMLKRHAKLRHAAIGVGGMGFHDLGQIAAHSDVEIVAICDVDTSRFERATEHAPDARRYQDWRELLRREAENIDSINVTTPDHMHAAITLTALSMGKHVYCQKPLTHDIFEARRVREAAARAGVATQMGIQLSSTAGDRNAIELIRTGAIGKITAVYLWSNKDPWKYRPTGPRPENEDRVPESLDWDIWLGTAPVRPYVSEVYHPTFWRGWQDFGVGWLGDMGCHITHAPFAALGLTAPLTVRAEVEPEWRDTPGRRNETWPTWQIVRYTYPGTDLTAGETIEVTWSDGDRYPPDELREHIEGGNWPEQGALVIGEKGAMLHPHQGTPGLFPADRFADHAMPGLSGRNHYHHWVDACLGRTKTEAGFEYAGRLTEAVLVGTVALRVPDRELHWDSEALSFTDNPEANRFIRRTYRAGWEAPGL